MSIVVVTPPQPLVSAADAKAWAPVLAGDDDVRVNALLRAAQFAIEPPNGWVGRAFGVQTLEARFRGFEGRCLSLPCPPVRQIVKVLYDDVAGVEQELPASFTRLVGAGSAVANVVPRVGDWPRAAGYPESVRVQFEAGYEAGSPEVEPVRHAIVLGAVQLRSLTTQDLALRSREVEGVGSRTWVVSEVAQALVRSAVESLLMPLRVYS